MNLAPLRELPSETNARFTMLISAAVFLTIHLALVIVVASGLLGPTLEAQLTAIATTSNAIPKGGSILDLSVAERVAYASEQQALAFAALRTVSPMFVLPVIALGFFWATAYLLYRLHPNRILRRYSHQTTTFADAPHIFEELERLGGPFKYIHLVAVDTMNSALARMVFGFPGSYQLLMCINTSLLKDEGIIGSLELVWDEPVVKASILHEIGHIRYGDVRWGLLSEAIWVSSP